MGAEQAPASDGQAPDELPLELLLLETPPLELLPPTVTVPLELPPLLELDDALHMEVQVEPPDDELEDSEPRLWPPVDPQVDPPLPPPELLPPSQSTGLVQAFASMSQTCPVGQSQSQLQYDEPSSKQNEPTHPDAEPPASTP